MWPAEVRFVNSYVRPFRGIRRPLVRIRLASRPVATGSPFRKEPIAHRRVGSHRDHHDPDGRHAAHAFRTIGPVTSSASHAVWARTQQAAFIALR